MIVRLIEPFDWPMLELVFRLGDTYAFTPNISEVEAYHVCVEKPKETYVAVEEGDDSRILGTYRIKPNQPTIGTHVCSCGYIVAAAARGKGIATAMCKHSQAEAKQLGFIAMQFNLVVPTNTPAIRL